MILVTGGAGFIGSHITDALIEGGEAVRVLDLLHPAAHGDKPDYLNPAAEYRWADLRDPAAVDDALAGVTAVCHQASMVGLGAEFGDIVDYVSHNDTGTAVLLGRLHACGFDGRIVLGSSMAVYGEGAYTCPDGRCPAHGPGTDTIRPVPRSAADLAAGRFEPPCPACGAPLEPGLVGEDAPAAPRNVYAATKLHQEHLCAAYAGAHRSPLTVLRYHNVYGPRMPRDTPYAGVAALFRSALEAGRPPLVFEDGGQRRDFVHVADVARANVAALTALPVDGGPERVAGTFNIASGEPHTVLDMARAIAVAFGPSAPPPQVTGGFRPGDVRHVVASPARAAAALGFKAEIPFAAGMAEFATAALRDPVSGPRLRAR